MAALACFQVHGYDGTSIDFIAARSGLPVAVVSERFSGKAEIWSALLALWSERLSAWITNA
jgi:AcrR family transcriptional regulator